MMLFTEEDEKYYREQHNKFTQQLNKKQINSQLFKCNSCNQDKKKGCYRTLNILICIECEKLKYKGKKLPKVKKVKSNKSNLATVKVSSFAGVYKITCVYNGKSYIGESSNLRRRLDHYVNKTGYINPLLLEDLEKYSNANFTFEVLALMKGSSKEDRLSVEYHYKQLHSKENLYNILPGKESKEDYEKWKATQ